MKTLEISDRAYYNLLRLHKSLNEIRKKNNLHPVKDLSFSLNWLLGYTSLRAQSGQVDKEEDKKK